VDDEGHVVRHAEGVEERVEELAVACERVAPGVRAGQLVRVAHPDQIGRDAAPEAGELRDHVAPQIRRCRVAVQQHDRGAIALLDIRHAVPERIGVPLAFLPLHGCVLSPGIMWNARYRT
jgi:hypothetical protein